MHHMNEQCKDQVGLPQSSRSVVGGLRASSESSIEARGNLRGGHDDEGAAGADAANREMNFKSEKDGVLRCTTAVLRIKSPCDGCQSVPLAGKINISNVSTGRVSAQHVCIDESGVAPV
mmetsp:Transcript_37797/g.68863  ORF Transcript_37797/g.68863 Transcript_37797/m.68863 type:complete len:119 (-) Transcript_37797:493-849(-)